MWKTYVKSKNKKKKKNKKCPRSIFHCFHCLSLSLSFPFSLYFLLARSRSRSASLALSMEMAEALQTVARQSDKWSINHTLRLVSQHIHRTKHIIKSDLCRLIWWLRIYVSERKMCVFVCGERSVYSGTNDEMIKRLYSPVHLSCVHMCTFFLCLLIWSLLFWAVSNAWFTHFVSVGIALQLAMSPRQSAEHDSTHRFWVCTKINLFDKSTRVAWHERENQHTQLALDTVS